VPNFVLLRKKLFEHYVPSMIVQLFSMKRESEICESSSGNREPVQKSQRVVYASLPAVLAADLLFFRCGS